MSMWARVQKLDGEPLQQVGLMYAENFPIDVRCALADWIEEQPWHEVDPDNPNHDEFAAVLVNDLIKKVEFIATTGDNFLMRLKLREAANDFRRNYSDHPQQLVRVIKNCLQTEMTIIQDAENFPDGFISQMDLTPDPDQEINLTLNKLRTKTQVTMERIRDMVQKQEALLIESEESAKLHAQLQLGSLNPEMTARCQQQKQMLDQGIRVKVAYLVNLRIEIVGKQQRMIAELHDLQTRILETELSQWKREQQSAGNGAIFENNLDQIQRWCEGLADIIWQNRQIIKEIESVCSKVQLNVPGDTMDKLPNLKSEITSLFSSLVASTLVIERQPPQVIKVATRFNAAVRLLVGYNLGLAMTPPQVKVTIISEAQTIALLQNDNNRLGDIWTNTPAWGEIINNIGTLEYNKTSRQLSLDFKNLQLRKCKRSEKKGTESVMDEKFSILFVSHFIIGGGEFSFKVWTLSLPVVVIVHGIQEPHAWATITWDNGFAEPARVPFQVPERVPWSEMAEVLKTKFRAATGRELMPENLQFLGCKALRSTQILHNDAITWSQFCKENLPDRNFTFWEWFYAILKTTREHLRNLWNDRLILGFISRQQAEEMLLTKVDGTFLLRFSDSELGGVTIAWVAYQREGPEILMIQPFTSRDFAIRSLADRIKDLNNLVYLYPDIPKDNAFGKYYTLERAMRNVPHSGNIYKKIILVNQLIDDTNNGGNGYCIDSAPGTPQSQSSSDMACRGMCNAKIMKTQHSGASC